MSLPLAPDITDTAASASPSHIHPQPTQDEELALFLELVAEINRGADWGYFWTPDGAPYTDKSGNVVTPKESFWYRTGRHMRPPQDWVQNRNCYFGVAGTAAPRGKHQRTTNDSAAALGAFFADIDAKDYVTQEEWKPYYQAPEITAAMSPAQARGALVRAQNEAIDKACKADLEKYRARALQQVTNAPLPATAVWDTGGGYHCVWLLDKPIVLDDETRPLAHHLEREWVQRLGADPAATDFARVLRVPGTYNRKPKYAPDYPPVRFLWCNLETRYTVDQFAALLPGPAAPTKQRARAIYIPQGVSPDLSSVGAVPRLPRHKAIDDFNARTDLRTLLLEIGYQPSSSPRRLSRPGGDSAGVELHPDNTASIFSSADPLYGKPRITPADALCVYQYGGQVDALLDALTAGVWRSAERALRAAGAYIHEVDLQERLGVERYRARERDLAVADALIEVMQQRHACAVTVSWRTLRKMTNYGSVSRIAEALANLKRAGILTQVDAATGEITQQLALTEAFINEALAFVRNRITPSEDNDLCPDLASVEGDPVTHKTFRDHRADDAFIAVMTPISPESAETDTYSARYKASAVFQRRRDALAASLGRGALFVLDRLVDAGGEMDMAALIGIGGRSRFTIRRNVNRLCDAGLVAEREEGVLTLFPDWDTRLDAIRPLMPTAGSGRRRLIQEAKVILDECDQHEAEALAAGHRPPAWLEQRRFAAEEILRKCGAESPEDLRKRRERWEALPEATRANLVKTHKRGSWMRWDQQEINRGYRDAAAAWQALQDLPVDERRAKMKLAGYSADDLRGAQRYLRCQPVLKVEDAW